MEKEQLKKLIAAAQEARGRAYAPYSGFHVGAALLTKEGAVFTGSNVENISYPAGLCAERVALFSAVSAGYREFSALIVTGGMAGKDPEDFCMPCGMCLQAISEFCSPDFAIYVAKNAEEVQRYCLRDLLPYAFDSLKK